jgi:hypothetical protein
MRSGAVTRDDVLIADDAPDLAQSIVNHHLSDPLYGSAECL